MSKSSEKNVGREIDSDESEDGESVPGLVEDQYDILDWENAPGKIFGSVMIFTKCEQRLYSTNSVRNQYGIAYRCYDRSCRARRTMCPNGLFIALKTSKKHTCTLNHIQKNTDLRAENEFKSRCGQIERIAGSSKMATVRSIFKGVIEE